jgi:hypothetical protein
VKENFRRAQLLDDFVFFVKGKVEETWLTRTNSPSGSLCSGSTRTSTNPPRLSWKFFYPRLVAGGVLIIDDYGHWAGARKAVDEYFKNDPVLVNRIGYTARLVVRR